MAQKRTVPIDTTVITKHTTQINGSTVSYTATTGMQPLWDDMGEPIASLYYTYYKRDNVSKGEERPILISFNGGPGNPMAFPKTRIPF